MQLGGKRESRMRMVLPIPRVGEDDLIFILTPVESYDKFNELCPIPKPPILKKAGGVEVPDIENDAYVNQLTAYATLQSAYIMLSSLKNTPDLVFETVDPEKPSTWDNYKQEMRDFGLSEQEMLRILRAVQGANSLDDGLVDEARNRYFRNLDQLRKREEDEVPAV